MNSIEFRENIPVRGEYDIIVAGGGVAGAAAALSAKRLGKSVLLIEKSLTIGGLATMGLINLFVSMCNGRGKKIITGMAEEFLQLSIKYGFDTLADEWRNGEPGHQTARRYYTQYSAYIFAMALAEQLNQEGVDVLLDTVVSSPVMDGNLCKGLIVENKTGRGFYAAKAVVDTTGDADVIFRAGVPTVQGNNFATYSAYGMDMESCKRAFDAKDIGKVYIGFCGDCASLEGHRQPSGVRFYQGTTAEDITEYVLDNQHKLMDKIRDNDPDSREVAQLPAMPQFRTTRRMDADYTMTLLDRYKHFEDSVGTICDFSARDHIYEVPLRALVRKDFPNLITAGRSAAAAGYMWDILRVIPPAILTGQAAGIAAAIADGGNIAEVDIKKLQKLLAEGGVMVHFDDTLVPPSGDHWDDVATEDIGHI